MCDSGTDNCDAQISQITDACIKGKGYPLEKHSVTTEDGYIISIYRIPYGKEKQPNNTPRPPVLLCHGLSCNCAIFVNQCCLAYYLADEGFDVWLPNNRGNSFSRKHTTWDADKDKEKYWNFSWHEIGIYDIPSSVDYILEQTSFKKVNFIGHSQGVTAFAVFASERPEYNEKIALCCLLTAPIIFQNSSSYVLKFIAYVYVPLFEAIQKYLKLPVYEMPFTGLTRLLGMQAKPNTLHRKLGQFLLFFIAGNPNYEQTSNIDFAKFSSTNPDSSSIRQACHYAQIVRNGRFAKYDYGAEENIKVYGSEKSPLYDLSRITSPVALFYGKNDMYTDIKEQIIKDNGQSLEIHQVTTEDGYINSLYRISPNSKISKKPPVLLVHGLLSSVADSVLEERHLGNYLVKNGFDVWMANCRGTTYSRGHVKYDHVKDPEEYWNFSFHEIGYYDHPAFIDHILKETGLEKLIYIGVSQGTTTFTVLMSTRPEYNAKIALACLLCPAIYFDNARFFPAKFLFCYFVPFIQRTTQILHMPAYETPFTHPVRKLMSYADENKIARWFSENIFTFMAGHPNPEAKYNMNFRRMCVTVPNTASFKQILHFSQVMEARRFARYDHGYTENMKIYESQHPPLYDLSKVTAPIGIFYSQNDMFYNTKDIDELAANLENCIHKHLVEHEKFNHLDFLYNQDVIPLLYTHVLDLINKNVS